MLLLYIAIFFILILISAFFSSVETSILALNKIKLNLKVKKNNKKAVKLMKILNKPDEFFSTVLIGNNFVNIAAASISTVVFTRLTVGNELLDLLISMFFTSIFVLLLAEVIPKSYAYRYSERIAFSFVGGIEFFSKLLYPMVKVAASVSRAISRGKATDAEGKEISVEELKHFLSSEIEHFKFHPESLQMVHEIIDIAEKDIKTILTPRLNVIALNEKDGLNGLKNIIIEKKISNIPVYRCSLDNIIGIIHNEDILSTLIVKSFNDLDIDKIIRPPLFISEYSSLHYVLKLFKKHNIDIAIVVDEYGSTIGILTYNDILREILGEVRLGQLPIKKVGKNTYLVKGNTPVEEVNDQLHIALPSKVDYTTISGFFIYHFGKYPKERSKLKIKGCRLSVKRMGKRKIEEILVIVEEKE